MSAGKHAAADVLPRIPNDRHLHLNALRAAIEARPELRCGRVERRGVTWVSVGGARRPVEVGCDYLRSTWWFTWGDGRPFAPARDVPRAVDVLVRGLVGG